jgi:hypothetical protein
MYDAAHTLHDMIVATTGELRRGEGRITAGWFLSGAPDWNITGSIARFFRPQQCLQQ